MEIRTLVSGERDALLDLLAGAPAGDGWRGSQFVRQQMKVDPTFHEQNVWVASDRGELIACAQIFPRRLRILGHGIPTGGLGAVYTSESYRGQGVATAVVEHAAAAMRERGMELSVVFAIRHGLFKSLGWNTWTGQRSILRRSDKRPAPAGEAAEQSEIELVPFERSRDRALAAVKAIHSAYSGSRSGTVIRDDGLWEASLVLAGNPDEEFQVARRGGLAVAYARAALRPDGLTVTELGRFEDGGAALAKLVASLLEPRENDPLARAGRSTQEVRSFVVLPTFDDISLTVCLEHEGVAAHPVDDERGLIRCLNLTALAARLDVDLMPHEDEAGFLSRILPPDGFVFWPADDY